VIPQSISNVPTEKIVALRNRHAAARANFQEHLHKIVTEVGELKEITDRDALRAQLEVMHEKQLKPQLDEYKRLLKALGIETVMGAFNVRAAVPNLVAMIPGLGPIDPILSAGAGIAFSLLPIIRDKRKEARDLNRSSPVAYLMNVEEGLRTPSLTQWIGERARQFFFHV
jgi:uncharacterized protein DUF6236